MAAVATRVEEVRWRGEPALRLHAGSTAVTVLPGLGLTGVSWRVGRREHLATPGGLAALRAGHTSGLPLLAPWANRVDPHGYRVGRTRVDLRGLRLHRDGNRVPIHGLLLGAAGWQVPWRVSDRRLDLLTTVVPTGRRRVPIAFGWHPYLRLPGTPRSRWHLRMPARQAVALDGRGLPTGTRVRVPAERAEIGSRTFDDLYALGRDRALALETDDESLVVRPGAAYPFAQVWVPPGRTFAALEPMTAPTNALGLGGAPQVAPGDAFTARCSFLVE
jgi:aldose 1-epimerase